jgi:hypothetical protein
MTGIGLNPQFDWRQFGGQTLQDIGVGLTQSPTFAGGIGRAAQIGQQMQPYRDQQDRIKQEDEAKQKAIVEAEQLRSKYATFFEQQGQGDWARAVADGLVEPGAAYMEWMQGKAPGEPMKGVVVNDRLVNPVTGELIGDYSSSDAPKPTSSMQEYEYARSQGYTGTFQQYETEMKKAGATNIDFNANQGTAAAYADRMATANEIISDPKIEAAMMDIGKQGASRVPIAGNFLVGPEFQQAEQAKRDFINAILRRESGATIRDEEFQSANQQYFPQPGDTPQVLAQKAENRRIAIEGVARAAGPNYSSPSITPPGVVDYTTYFGG